MKHAKRTIAILSLALAGCQSPIMPSSPTPTVTTIRLFTEASTAPLLYDLAAAYQPDHTLIAWDIRTGDLSTLAGWLDKGAAPFALTNYLPSDSTLWSTPIGQDGLAILINAANPVSSLSPDQLRAIFTGRALNWKTLGGTDLPLTVVSRQPGSSDNALFQALILGERPVAGAAVLATTSASAIQAILADRGAVGYVSMSVPLSAGLRAVALDQILPTVQAVSENRYELRSPLLFVGKQAPGNDAYRDFFAWTQSPAGQAIIGRNYGVLKPGG